MIADFNSEHWPIVYVKFNNNELNDESFEEYKKYYLNLLIKCKKENSKMYIIFNLDNTKSLPMNYIVKQIQFNKEIEKFNKEYIKLASIICKSKAFKNILNLYFSMSKQAAPFKIFRCFNKMNTYFIDKFNINFNFYLLEPEMNNIIGEEGEEEEEEEENKENSNNIKKK
jgi:hypothetical protein